MNKLAAYELILTSHSLWEKSAGAKRLERILRKHKDLLDLEPGQLSAAQRAFEKLRKRVDKYPGGGFKYLKDATGQDRDTIDKATDLMHEEGSPALMKMITRKNKAGPLPMD